MLMENCKCRDGWMCPDCAQLAKQGTTGLMDASRELVAEIDQMRNDYEAVVGVSMRLMVERAELRRDLEWAKGQMAGR